MTESHRQELPAHAIDKIAAFLGGRGLGTVIRLPLKPLVADCCEKFVALDVRGQPAAFIAVSPRSYADSVRDAVRTTREVAQALGAALGDTVLLPHFVGEIDGRSYSITSFRRPLSTGRLRGRWERLRLRPAALAWLAQVTRQTAQAVSAVDEEVRAPLHALAAQAGLDAATRRAAHAALEALDRGQWHPRSVTAHNDLWWGNFVHRDDSPASCPPFQIIDWAGAEVRGAAIYDLVRLADSLGMSARQYSREMRHHCDILGCRPEHSLHYLSLALGRLSRNLGEWPAAHFASTANACLRYASEAL